MNSEIQTAMEAVEEKKYLMLTPTQALSNKVNFLLDPNIESNKWVVAIGDGTKSSTDDLNSLEHELEKIDINKIAALEDRKSCGFQINVSFYEANDLILSDPVFPELRCVGNKDYKKYLSVVNSLTHIHCRVEGKIFIFPINLFQDESISFYIYDTFNSVFSIEKLPINFLEKIGFDYLSYDTCRVVPVNKKIYFFLTKSNEIFFHQRISILNTEYFC